MNVFKFLALVCLFSAVFLVGAIVSWYYDPFNMSTDVFVINDNMNHTNSSVGHYLPNKYYLVETEHRSTQDIIRTTMHEHCHYLIEVDTRNHFCNERICSK